MIGASEDAGELTMQYFDSRGVRRTYGIALEDGVLRIWRDDPRFAQRYLAMVGAQEFDGRWQVAETPGDWRDDLHVVHRRIS